MSMGVCAAVSATQIGNPEKYTFRASDNGSDVKAFIPSVEKGQILTCNFTDQSDADNYMFVDFGSFPLADYLPGGYLEVDSEIDNPILRIQDGQVVAYGTPWSGKTPCYRNLSFPVDGMVRLRQAQTNRFTPCRGTEAFIQLLPGCSVIRQDRRLYEALCDTLVKMADMVPVGRLDCQPDEEAARLCSQEISRLLK